MEEGNKRVGSLIPDKVECHWNGTIYFIDPEVFHEILYYQDHGAKRFVRSETGCKIFDMSQHTFDKIAEKADAVHKDTGTKLIDIQQVTRYILSLGPKG